MGNPRKTKDKRNKDKAKDNEPVSKTRETPRTEEGATARAGEAEEPPTSQVQDAPVEMSGDDDGSTQQLSNPFTAQQNEQITAFYGRYPVFYDMGHPDYNNKKRDFVTKQFAQSLFPSGKCFLLFKYIFHRRVSLTSTCKILVMKISKVFSNDQRVQVKVLKRVRSLCVAQPTCVDFLFDFRHLDTKATISL